MTSLIETIKAKVDVADEIGLVVALQKSGKSLKGLCPFHNERSPSFYVFRETQTWHCFGCNKGGDVFSFVQEQQGLDFHETLQYLAEKAGVLVEEHSGGNAEEERAASAAKDRLRKLNEDAQLWFHQMLLHSKEAEEARAYVQSRGISSESVLAFGLGYASERWDGLTSYLLGQGHTEEELVTAGLARWRESEALKGERASIYDYFRQRLIFPIRDMRGRVIGFGGRALGESKPKYLNSPQTILFEKSTVLYAIDMAKEAIKQVGQVVIVEGYVDAVIAHQYGTKQTVACIGSAITEKHIQQLKKMTKQVTLALDPDAAGSAATEQGIQEALKGFDRTVVPVPLASTGFTQRANGAGGQQSVSFRSKQQSRGIIRLEEQVDAEINVLQLPAGEDPDEVIRRDFSTWLYAVSHPLALIDYYFVIKTADLDLREPLGKSKAAKRLLPIIGMISDRIKRDAYIRKLSSLISIDERSLYEELQQVLRNQKSTGVTVDFSGKTPATRQAQLQQRKDASRESVSERDEENEESQGQMAVAKRQNPGLDRQGESTLKWEDYLIGLLLRNPSLNQQVCVILDEGDFAGTDTRELYRLLNSVYQRDSSPSHQPFENFVPSALMPSVVRAIECVELRSSGDGEVPSKEAIQCATRLKRMRLLQLNKELNFLLKDAVDAGDLPALRQLQQQLLAIHQQLRTIDTATHLQG
jgi:DNA primase